MQEKAIRQSSADALKQWRTVDALLCAKAGSGNTLLSTFIDVTKSQGVKRIERSLSMPPAKARRELTRLAEAADNMAGLFRFIAEAPEMQDGDGGELDDEGRDFYLAGAGAFEVAASLTRAAAGEKR